MVQAYVGAGGHSKARGTQQGWTALCCGGSQPAGADGSSQTGTSAPKALPLSQEPTPSTARINLMPLPRPQGEAGPNSPSPSGAQRPLLCRGRFGSLSRARSGARAWTGGPLLIPTSFCSSAVTTPQQKGVRNPSRPGGGGQRGRKWALTTNHPVQAPFPTPQSLCEPLFPHPRNGRITSCYLGSMKGWTAEAAGARDSRPASGVGEVGRAGPGLGIRRPGITLLQVGGWVAHPRDGL